VGPVVRQALIGAAGSFLVSKLAALPQYQTDTARLMIVAGAITGEIVATKIMGGTVGEYAASTILGSLGGILTAPLLGHVPDYAEAAVNRALGGLAYAGLWGNGINAAAVAT